MTLKRFSSRTERLDTEFLAKTLKSASKYFRIAGYFRSSIFELVGEEIAQIPEVKIICNSELDLVDFQVATGGGFWVAIRDSPPAYGLTHREKSSLAAPDQCLPQVGIQPLKNAGMKWMWKLKRS